MPLPSRHRTSLALFAVAGLSVLGACADQPGRSDLVDGLVTSGISKAEAECTVDAVYDSLDHEEIESLVERGASGAPRNDVNVTGEPADLLNEAVTACRDAAAATSVGPATEGVGGTASTTTAAPGADAVTTTEGAGGDSTTSTTGGDDIGSTSTTVPAGTSGGSGDGASLDTTEPG